MPPSPVVTIVIVLWNSEKHLPDCFSALRNQKFTDFDIVVIDNGSVKPYDGNLPDNCVLYERLASNIGFAAANNLGMIKTQGEWIVLLNADAYPEPEWLENLLKAAEQNPQYNFFSSRQIQYNAPHLLDGAGDEYHVSGLAWRRFYNHLANGYGLKPEEVFGACAAAVMYRREDFLKIGGFDEDYFSYFEDVDLSFRLRLAGGRCLYVPDAIVHHVGSASTGKLSDFVVYYGHRNLVWTFFKDMPGLLFWVYLPVHLLMNLFFLFSFIFKGKGVAILRSKWDAFRMLPRILKKRKQIQATRKISYKEILMLMRKKILDPYWASRQRKLESNRKS